MRSRQHFPTLASMSLGSPLPLTRQWNWRNHKSRRRKVLYVRLGGERDGIHAAVEIFRMLGIRCIFATAYYDQHLLERAGPAMPLGWLQKPYSMVSLVNAVRRAVEELDRNR